MRSTCLLPLACLSMLSMAAPPPQPGQAATGPISLTLESALASARAYSQQFQTAVVAAASAREDVLQARTALLPTLTYFNQYIYTQGNGTPSGIFVANDGVHVYNSQANVHGELFSIANRANYRKAMFAAAAAQARQDIARRGLIATVVSAYYGLIAAQRHLANAQTALKEAQQFFDITQKQERGGEVAHADVVKAELNVEQRKRDLQEAQLNVEKARINLGVTLFPNVDQEFNIDDDLATIAPLPALSDIQSEAISRSPDMRAAEATVKSANYGVSAAKGAYYPSLVFDYWYGIDANVFGIRGPDDRKNLGSVAQGTVNIPVWNWGATRSRVRQAELQQQQAQADLTFAQRSLQSTISSSYAEAQTSLAELDSLKRSLDLSVESLRLTILRYEAGEATALEVSDAQSTLAQARNAYDDGLARYRVALASLQILTGSL
ncbi:MAG: TolC family protein [Bryobacteraceae bacterium]